MRDAHHPGQRSATSTALPSPPRIRNMGSQRVGERVGAALPLLSLGGGCIKLGALNLELILWAVPATTLCPLVHSVRLVFTERCWRRGPYAPASHDTRRAMGGVSCTIAGARET